MPARASGYASRCVSRTSRNSAGRADAAVNGRSSALAATASPSRCAAVRGRMCVVRRAPVLSGRPPEPGLQRQPRTGQHRGTRTTDTLGDRERIVLTAATTAGGTPTDARDDLHAQPPCRALLKVEPLAYRPELPFAVRCGSACQRRTTDDLYRHRRCVDPVPGPSLTTAVFVGDDRGRTTRPSRESSANRLDPADGQRLSALPGEPPGPAPGWPKPTRSWRPGSVFHPARHRLARRRGTTTWSALEDHVVGALGGRASVRLAR